MKVGDFVKYRNDKNCQGVIIEIGSNLYRVKWNNHDVEEWMPGYALEVIINECRRSSQN